MGLIGKNASGDLVTGFIDTTTGSLRSVNYRTSGAGALFAEKGSTTGYNKPFLQSVAESEITGYSYMNKFGEAVSVTTSIDPADVWDGANVTGTNLYTFSATANIDKLSSSDDTDTQTITVYGLTAAYVVVTQTITLTGQTPVALTTPLMRVYRMVNTGATNTAGTIYCFVNVATTAGVPDTLTNIRAMILPGNNQTMMCVYTIPAGKTGYLLSWNVSVTSSGVQAQSGICSFRARPFGQVFQVKDRVALVGNADSTWQNRYQVPIALTEKTDVLIRVDTVTATMSVAGGFNILLKDN